LSCDVLAWVVMDVISPTRFIRVHPSSMNTVIIWTTIVLIIPEQNNNYWNKSWRLGLIPTRNTITLYLFSMRIIPYSFASYLGHCSSCIALFCMTLHTNQSGIPYPRTTLRNKQWIHPWHVYHLYTWSAGHFQSFIFCQNIFQILF